MVQASEKSAANESPRAPQVLIVEDNKVNQITLRKMLLRCGVEVSTADDGLLGIRICQSNKFDLILMDLSMPNLDGYDTTREIIANCPLNKKTPIVAVSANTGKEAETRCLKVGMSGFAPKPLRMERVQGLVEQYLSS